MNVVLWGKQVVGEYNGIVWDKEVKFVGQCGSHLLTGTCRQRRSRTGLRDDIDHCNFGSSASCGFLKVSAGFHFYGEEFSWTFAFSELPRSFKCSRRKKLWLHISKNYEGLGITLQGDVTLYSVQRIEGSKSS